MDGEVDMRHLKVMNKTGRGLDLDRGTQQTLFMLTCCEGSSDKQAGYSGYPHAMVWEGDGSL